MKFREIYQANEPMYKLAVLVSLTAKAVGVTFICILLLFQSATPAHGALVTVKVLKREAVVVKICRYQNIEREVVQVMGQPAPVNPAGTMCYPGKTKYRVTYQRPDGYQGQYFTISRPIGGFVTINLCGDTICR